MQSILGKIKTFFLDFLETIVVALSIFVVVYLFLFQPHEVNGASLEPNFHNGEYILTDKITKQFKPFERGNVVIFKSPANPEIDYIKRIIGLPGDRVKVENGGVYVNGELLNENYIDVETKILGKGFIGEGEEITVPNDEFFVMGDNRFHSSDSREFGTIKKSSIIGKAFVRYWPINKLGLLPQVKY